MLSPFGSEISFKSKVNITACKVLYANTHSSPKLDTIVSYCYDPHSQQWKLLSSRKSTVLLRSLYTYDDFMNMASGKII